MGSPGSGKTTIAKKLALSELATIIETGELLRKESIRETQSGKKIKHYLESGDLVPTNYVVKVIDRAIAQTDGDIIIFDGFPRKSDQIEPFFKLKEKNDFLLQAVIGLKLSSTVAKKRLTGRRVCSQCGAVYNSYYNPPDKSGTCDNCNSELRHRPDDSSEHVEKRLRIYNEQTMPVFEYFKKHDPIKTFSVSAEKPKEEVFESVLQVLQKVGFDCVSNRNLPKGEGYGKQ